MADYNPYILGFVRHDGHFGELWIPLQQALNEYGDLPSRFGLLPAQTKSRKEKRALNLKLGTAINRVLQCTPDLKRRIHRFYRNWHRDWQQEFGVDVAPLFNRTDPASVIQRLNRRAGFLAQYDAFDVRSTLAQSGLLRLDVLNSIPEASLSSKAIEMLERKRRALGLSESVNERTIGELLQRLRIRQLLDRLATRIECRASLIEAETASVYADDIAATLQQIDGEPLMDGPESTTIRFEYATRDAATLSLGSQIGDCTAKPYKQLDRHTENIYWTVYPWILDHNYLILKVLFEGHLVMKVHLLPLAAYESGGVRLFLAVDAVETAIGMRHDIPGENRVPSEQCGQILERTQAEIERVADAMGIADIYAEIFSNNPLVRRWLESFDRSYLDVTTLHKVDELEDVFTLAGELTREYGELEPDHVFMEIQFRNTQLMSHQTPRPNIKGFARLRRGALSGLEMGKVIGV